METEPTGVRPAMPVLETKLRRPSISPSLVARPRLLEQLTASLDRRLILVSASAGYGKTAVVSQWLDSIDSTHAWFSLDEQDGNLATFLLYLVAAIRTVYPDAMHESELLLRAPMPLAPTRLAVALLQDLAALPGPLILVLDDYHAIKALEVHALMARLVEHLPLCVHLVLVTRADPPLPLERLRGRRHLAEIRSEELRFRSEEATLLLTQMLGRTASEETAALLVDSTEGWAVGLHLAALSLRNQSDPAAFARKIAQNGQQAITEYLLSEVLTGLPEAQRDCLLQTSLFDRFCAALCDAVQAEDKAKLSGEDFVRAVRGANLFIVSLDDEGTWFRYHHYFQHLLRYRLSRRYTDAEIKAMHARASAWFAAHGLVDEAVIHGLQAGDAMGAATLVEEQVHPALDGENWRQVERWIWLLPSDVLKRPRLLAAQAWLHFLRYQFAAISAQIDAAEMAVTREPASAGGAETSLRGEINVLRAAIACNSGNGQTAVQFSQAALEQLRPEMQYAMGLANFYHILALQTSGQYSVGVQFAHRQLDVYGHQPGALTLRVLLGLANIHLEMADLAGLQETALAFWRMAHQVGLKLSIGWALYMQGWLEYQRNELVAAEGHFRDLLGMGYATHGRALLDGTTGLVLALVAQGRRAEVPGVIAGLREQLLDRGMLALAVIAESLAQRLALACQEKEALDWRWSPRSTPVPDDLWEQPALTQARTLLECGSPNDLTQAAELLADSRTKALARCSNCRLIEVGALQALVLSAQGQEAAALAALQEAVERAAPGGALRLLVDCGPRLIGLLQKVQAAGVAPRYVQKVLEAFDAHTAPPAVPAIKADVAALGNKQEVPLEILTNREIDVLMLLAQRLSDKEIAERLVLSPVTVKKHTQRIYRKLGVDNRRAAAVQARRLGLL